MTKRVAKQKKVACVDVRIGPHEAPRERSIAFLKENRHLLGATFAERGFARRRKSLKMLRVYTTKPWKLVEHVRTKHPGGERFGFTVHKTRDEADISLVFYRDFDREKNEFSGFKL